MAVGLLIVAWIALVGAAVLSAVVVWICRPAAPENTLVYVGVPLSLAMAVTSGLAIIKEAYPTSNFLLFLDFFGCLDIFTGTVCYTVWLLELASRAWTGNKSFKKQMCYGFGLLLVVTGGGLGLLMLTMILASRRLSCLVWNIIVENTCVDWVGTGIVRLLYEGLAIGIVGLMMFQDGKRPASFPKSHRWISLALTVCVVVCVIPQAVVAFNDNASTNEDLMSMITLYMWISMMKLSLLLFGHSIWICLSPTQSQVRARDQSIELGSLATPRSLPQEQPQMHLGDHLQGPSAERSQTLSENQSYSQQDMVSQRLSRRLSGTTIQVSDRG